jgi:NAD(P)-dependent dehydrogenase (short-subunit alcohol dehydrogenase family)
MARDGVELAERVFLVTGANTGIGRVTAHELARRGGHVVLACRSESKTAPVIDAIKRDTGNDNVEFLALDLGNFVSIRAAARSFLDTGKPLHGLINNAGLAGQRGVTDSGFERAFGVNHVGHFLLTKLLLDRLRESAPARVVTVASKAHFDAEGIDYEAVRRKTKTVTGVPEYGVSKLANVLFSAELARRVEGSGVSTYSLHPGVVASDVWRKVPWPVRSIMKMFMISVEQGAQTTLHCATSDEVAGETGLYYDKCKSRHPSRVAQDTALAKDLWDKSEAWVSG